MNIYKTVKWMKDSKKKDKATVAAESGFQPNHYGNISPAFGIYLGGVSDDAIETYYYLCEPGPKPFLRFTSYTSTGKRKLTVHSTIDPASPPLAHMELDKSFRWNFHGRVFLPAPPGSQLTQSEAQVESKGDSYFFEAAVGQGTRLRSEKFEWRQIGKPERDKVTGKRIPQPYELIRTPDSSRSEVFERVARWQEHVVPEEGKMGDFQFLGSGANGELGDYGRLMSVVSLLIICRIKWLAEQAAKHMVEQGGKALGQAFALGTSIGI